MAQTIVMPRFGATMEEGTVNAWSVREGDVVAPGDVLGEISIEKLTNELLAETPGVILKIIAREGDTLPCGAPILIMGAAGESLEAPAAPPPAPQSKTAAPAIPAELAASLPKSYSSSAQATPKGLQLARELGVDYHFIKGTGRFGMITRADIRLALQAGNLPGLTAAPAPAALTGVTRKMSQMELSIARAMDASLKNTAQTTISIDLDASAMLKAYQAHKEALRLRGVRLTYTAILIKLVASALVEHSLLRTNIVDASLVTRPDIHIGVAIDVSGGLVVPNIKNAHQKNIREIAVELEDLGKRARANSLAPDDITGGVFTITNLGMFGIKYFTPLLNPGESGILGVGTIQEVPLIKEGGIFVRTVINLSLTHDHRVVNGAPAARFLQAIQQNMDACETLFIGLES